ncbi:MAG: hypothetical protein QF898_18225 [SAR202 cluster bacterium]|jgi:hypothetical protein|nr:hypothetical protein [SAR202 cluster bacterium]MDP6715937.1 hypothetical protein [SAR202 cluster bacterium]
MFVEAPQNFEVTREIDFSLFGMGPKYRRRAERMQPQDRVLFYVNGIRKWPASATITSTYFEDNSPLWSPTTRNESFQYRVKLKADIVLDEEDYIDAMILGPRLDYVKRWAPENWPLAFWDRLHLLPQRDFRLIEGEMERIAARNDKPKRHSTNNRASHDIDDRSFEVTGEPAEDQDEAKFEDIDEQAQDHDEAPFAEQSDEDSSTEN